MLPYRHRLGHLAFLLLTAVGSGMALAAGQSLTLSSLGVTSYDSDYIGFGIVAENVDLASVDPSLAGISVTVSTSSPLDTSSARAWSSTYQPNPAVSRGPVTWTFEFSQPVLGEWQAVSQTLNQGERTTVTGAGTLETLSGLDWDSNLTTTSNSVENTTSTPIVQDFKFSGGASTTWTFTHEDTIGLFSGQVMQLSVLHAPEPSRVLLTSFALLTTLSRRRR